MIGEEEKMSFRKNLALAKAGSIRYNEAYRKFHQKFSTSDTLRFKSF